MSEDKSQKTEKPTSRRLREARKKGQVAQSREVVSTALILAIFLLILFGWQGQLQTFQALLLLPAELYQLPFDEALARLSAQLARAAAELIWPFLAIAVIVTIAASVLQFGFLLSFESVKLDLNKINPANGFKRIFNTKNLLTSLNGLIKVALLTATLAYIVASNLSDLIALPKRDVTTLLAVSAQMLNQLLIYLAPMLVVMAAIDYFLEKREFIKNQMMSMEEIKREFKQTEGDPAVKGQRRREQRKLASEDLATQVKTSTVVVAGGRAMAVALWYEKDTTPLPMVMAMGRDGSAIQILKLAEAADKPVVEDAALAAALLEKVKTNQYIPSELIEPVAAVMREVVAVT